MLFDSLLCGSIFSDLLFLWSSSGKIARADKREESQEEGKITEKTGIDQKFKKQQIEKKGWKKWSNNNKSKKINKRNEKWFKINKDEKIVKIKVKHSTKIE